MVEMFDREVEVINDKEYICDGMIYNVILGNLERMIESSRLYNQETTKNRPFDVFSEKPIWKSRKYNRSYLYNFLKKLVKYNRKYNLDLKIRVHEMTSDIYENFYGYDVPQYYENRVFIRSKDENRDINDYFNYIIFMSGTFDKNIYTRQTKDIIEQIKKFPEIELEVVGDI